MDTNIIRGKSVLTNIADAYSGTLSVGDTALVDGGIYLCKISATNTTTAPTLALNGLSAKVIYLNDGGALAIGSLRINAWVALLYDLTSDKFVWIDSISSNKIQQTFANKAARDAAVPDFDGQIGVQVDIDAVFQSYGTSAGNWRDIIPASNTVYADSVKGHTLAQGATGSKSNPFITLLAAKTAALLLSPTLSNRILIDGTGIFNEQIDLSDGAGAGVVGLDYNLNNSILELKAGDLYTIDDNNVACDSIIYGNAQILRSTAGTLGCIRIQHATSNVKIYCDLISSDIGGAVNMASVGSNTLKITANLITASSNSSNYTVINGGSGVLDITSNIGGATVASALGGGNGKLYIKGNVTNSYSGGGAVWNTGSGIVVINGNAETTTAGSTYVVYTAAGTTTINGNITDNGNAKVAIACGTSTLIINGNISSVITTNVILMVSGGLLTINNSIITSSCTATVSTLLVCSITLNNCLLTNSLSSGYGINPSTGTCTVIIKNCTITSGTRALIAGSATHNIRISNSRLVVTDATNRSVIDKNSFAFTLITDNCTFIATGTGECITSAGAAGNVKIYGTCQANTAINANVTPQIGTLIVDALVQ